MDGDQRHDQHGGTLYALLLVAAISVIVFSIIGIASMTGVMSNAAGDAAVRPSGGGASPGRPQRLEAPRREPLPQPGNPRTAEAARETIAL